MQQQHSMAAPAAATTPLPPIDSPSPSLLHLHALLRTRQRDAPTLPAHLMPARQASVEAALHTTRANNFPPANSEHQRYGPDELHHNAQQVGVSLEPIALSQSPGRLHPCLFRPFIALKAEILADRKQHWQDNTAPCEVRMSHHVCTKLGDHTQLGVFATRDIKTGEYIDHYADCVGQASQIQSSTWVRKVPNADCITDGAPLAWLYTRYISTTAGGLQQMRDLPATAFWPLATAGEQVIQRFSELPVGCIINSPSSADGAGKANVRSQLRLYKACGFGEYTRVIASCHILKGEELLMMYRNNEEGQVRAGLVPQPDPFPPAVRLYHCRATRHFASGEAIGCLWGMLATHEQWLDLTGIPARDSHEAESHSGKQQAIFAAESFLQPIRAGIWRCLPIRTRQGSNETSLTRLILSERCPMAHLGVATAGDSSQVNAVLPFGEALTLQLDDPATCFRSLVVRATRAIQPNEPILLDLGWTASAWAQRAATGSSTVSAAATSASAFNPYILPTDSPWIKHRKESQQKQWDNLNRFVQNNSAAYASFPYAPFTASSSSDLSSAHLSLGPSLVHSSLIGVRLKPASHTKNLILPYPGVLMPEALFSRFAREWHCPTAIDVPNLNPNDRTSVILVGDPRSFAANMNDPKGAKPDGAILARVKQHESIPLPPYGLVTVPDNFVYMEVSTTMLARVEHFIAPDAFKGEVVFAYENSKDKGIFWNSNSVEYCTVCFGKTQNSNNPLLACPTATCPHRRHLQCRLAANDTSCSGSAHSCV